jgi:hypothetical protein
MSKPVVGSVVVAVVVVGGVLGNGLFRSPKVIDITLSGTTPCAVAVAPSASVVRLQQVHWKTTGSCAQGGADTVEVRFEQKEGCEGDGTNPTDVPTLTGANIVAKVRFFQSNGPRCYSIWVGGSEALDPDLDIDWF